MSDSRSKNAAFNILLLIARNGGLFLCAIESQASLLEFTIVLLNFGQVIHPLARYSIYSERVLYTRPMIYATE